jgi:hypothetical protein
LALAASQIAIYHGFGSGLRGLNGGFCGAAIGLGGINGGLAGLGGFNGAFGGLGGLAGFQGGGALGGMRPQGFAGIAGFGGFGGTFSGSYGFQGFQGISGTMHLSLCEVATGKLRWQSDSFPGLASTLAFAPEGNALAAAMGDNTIVFWETARGQKVGQLIGHQGMVNALAFSPDGKVLVSASADGTIRLWNVSGLGSASRRFATTRSANLRTALWEDLGDHDAARAGQAMAELLGSPRQAVPYLYEKLKALPRVAAGQIPKLIADLDDSCYRVRREATLALANLGEQAGPALRQAIAERPASVEVYKRLEQLVARLENRELAPDDLRQLRALEVLERLRTRDARQALQNLARDLADSIFAPAARAALKRSR